MAKIVLIKAVIKVDYFTLECKVIIGFNNRFPESTSRLIRYRFWEVAYRRLVKYVNKKNHAAPTRSGFHGQPLKIVLVLDAAFTRGGLSLHNQGRTMVMFHG